MIEEGVKCRESDIVGTRSWSAGECRLIRSIDNGLSLHCTWAVQYPGDSDNTAQVGNV